jgi:cation transport ATPase
LTLRDDPDHEHARGTARERARHAAEEARAKADHERSKAEAKRAEVADGPSGEMQEETISQLGLIYGGLILIGVYMVQPFLTARSLDASARASVIAFAVAIPLLAALVLVNRQEAFRRRRTTSVTVKVAHPIAQAAAFVGIVAGFWHITWIAGATFLTVGFIATLVHSAGFWRVEEPRERT